METFFAAGKTFTLVYITSNSQERVLVEQFHSVILSTAIHLNQYTDSDGNTATARSALKRPPIDVD